MLTKRFARSATAAAIAAAMISPATYADDALNTDDIERIAVWSTEVKASSLYLKGEEIANKQADHISDLLRTIPGVDVGGAHSLNQRITIRSMDDKDLDISIDGAKQNTYMYHHMGNLQIHADILKSVDIEIGSNSVINGGLGGAVRFETKQARELLLDEEHFGGRIQVSAGNNAGSNYSATGYGLLGEQVDFLAYYNYVDRDNYEVGGGDIEDSSGDVIPGTDGEVRGLEGELDDALIKFGWNIDDNQRFQISYESYTDEGDYSYRPDMGLATDLAITNSLVVPLLWPTEFTRNTLTLNYELSLGSTYLKAAIYDNKSELWRDETGWAENPAYAAWAGIVTGEANNTGANLIAETAFDGDLIHDITYGFDYVRHETDYKAASTNGQVTAGEEATNLAIFVQDRITLNDQLTLIPGIRYDDYDIEATLVDNSFSETSLALALEYQITSDLLFKLSATELFKGPELAEVFVGAGSNDTPNQDINAETGVNYELAFAYQTTIGDGNLSIGGTYFVTDIEEYIYDYAAPPADSGARYWKDNIGDMKIDGYEVYAGYSEGQFDTSITFSQAESELDAFEQYIGDHDNARLDRQQGDTISAQASYELSEWNIYLNWEMLYVDDVDAGVDLDGPSLDNSKEGFTIHNISARWDVDAVEGLTLIVGADNLFDEFYASQSSRTGVSFHPRFGELYLQDYEPGRNIKATVSYQF
ncbi:TonB-dependent receptor [Thalassotalea sp. M1531]|uniref:TonB-dependent receptor n=1 Tax=Thalassotalea algicola TaxID=2716224 RepID=A0A7Y0LAD7_9GAMM|nr:TonB-dependent receptor [Thalassotalea algicola]NMP30712.1 TonB-dependent receptor [Thalassotalea algicola]